MDSKIQSSVAGGVANPVHATMADIRYKAGRRPEVKYRDLLVSDATNGRMRAEIMTLSSETAMNATGWHYHTCDIQFLYMLCGWVDLEIDGMGAVRLNEGESLMIPGGTVHQEVRTSQGMELLEVSVPAALGTVSCEPPTSFVPGGLT